MAGMNKKRRRRGRRIGRGDTMRREILPLFGFCLGRVVGFSHSWSREGRPWRRERWGGEEGRTEIEGKELV